MPRKKAASAKAFIHVVQYRSAIRTSPHQRAVLRGLGVSMRRSRMLEDTPAIRGMVAKISHIVQIVPDAAAEMKSASSRTKT